MDPYTNGLEGGSLFISSIISISYESNDTHETIMNVFSFALRGSHCKIKRMVYKRRRKPKLSGSVRHWAGFNFSKRLHLHVGQGMFVTADWEKSLCIFHRHWRLLIKGM